MPRALTGVKVWPVSVDLVSGAEIGRRLGVSREAVRQWAHRETFPTPLGRVGGSVVWDWNQVAAWSKERPAPVPVRPAAVRPSRTSR